MSCQYRLIGHSSFFITKCGHDLAGGYPPAPRPSLREGMVVLTEFDRKPLLFKDPIDIISTDDPRRMGASFDAMERALNAGHYLAGSFSYEAGYSFEERLVKNELYDFPLICMGVFRRPEEKAPKCEAYSVAAQAWNFSVNTSKEEYFKDIAVIKEHIAKGDVYQVPAPAVRGSSPTIYAPRHCRLKG